MRVIFSRKGFDSAAGGCASPIIDGRPQSLPIPTRMPTEATFATLGAGIADMVRDLTRGRVTAETPCHLDPDLDVAAMPRQAGWRGALGQVGVAQSHLANEGVSQGDLFLFWGLFRPARCAATRWEYCGAAEHRIFGWLQVGEIIRAGTEGSDVALKLPWLADHPHARSGWPASNKIYLSAPELALGGELKGYKGWGLFRKGRCLTRSGSSMPSTWSVPSWLNAATGGVGMTYHPLERWHASGELRVAARGQEFVADIGHRADALEWLHELFKTDA